MGLAYNSEQPRWVEIMACSGCQHYDLASTHRTTDSTEAPLDILFLDGHSNPPSTVLGRPVHELEALVATTAPQTLVGVTCNLAELDTLARLFEASPRLERVIASPATLPWIGLSDVAACCSDLEDANGCASCFVGVEELVHEFTRADIERARTLATAHLEDVRNCRTAPTLVMSKKHPPYLCLSFQELASPLIWRVQYEQLRQDCPAGVRAHPIGYSACIPGDRPGPLTSLNH